jgi:hypothetical protein
MLARRFLRFLLMRSCFDVICFDGRGRWIALSRAAVLGRLRVRQHLQGVGPVEPTLLLLLQWLQRSSRRQTSRIGALSLDSCGT